MVSFQRGARAPVSAPASAQHRPRKRSQAVTPTRRPLRSKATNMEPTEELAALLRPAGGGLYLVSTGKARQLALQQRLYGVSSEAQVQAAFENALARIATAKVVMLGIPSDVGAGFLRGANLGPQAIRQALRD